MGHRRNDRALFLSLRPCYAELLLAGEKTVELRRIRPRAQPGTVVLVYATSPRCVLAGTCVVASIEAGTPDEIWDLHGAMAAVPHADFASYFAGSDRAVAITVRKPTRLPIEVPLRDLRDALRNFQPPQSFRYVSLKQAEALLGNIRGGAKQLSLTV